MKQEMARKLDFILAACDPAAPHVTAEELRRLWLQFDPKSVAGIKAEQRKKQETVGIPVEVLRAIGNDFGTVARKRVGDFLPLARLLWEEYGREGRVVAAYALGKMELVEPERILPLLMELCRTCVT